VTVEWNIESKCRLPFLEALGCYARERRRDGAYDWALFEDPAQDGRFIETSLTDSWLEHMRFPLCYELPSYARVRPCFAVIRAGSIAQRSGSKYSRAGIFSRSTGDQHRRSK